MLWLPLVLSLLLISAVGFAVAVAVAFCHWFCHWFCLDVGFGAVINLKVPLSGHRLIR